MEGWRENSWDWGLHSDIISAIIISVLPRSVSLAARGLGGSCFCGGCPFAFIVMAGRGAFALRVAGFPCSLCGGAFSTLA